MNFQITNVNRDVQSMKSSQNRIYFIINIIIFEWRTKGEDVTGAGFVFKTESFQLQLKFSS